MVASKKPYTRKADAVSTRKHAIHKAPGYRLTDRERRILAAAWNGYVRRGLRISLRPFARMHALAAETWRREYRRGAAGATVRSGNRWSYAEYDPGRAADSVREGSANMGAPMRLTVVFDTGDDRLLTATFSKPSLAAYNKRTVCYSCDVRILLKDGRDVVVDQIRRLCIAPSGVEGLYEKRIGSAWMHDLVDEETGETDWDGSILIAFQNAWKRKGFEGLPQFSEKRTTVSVTDAALPPDPSEPKVDPGTADLTLDIAQNGVVTATLVLRDGGKARRFTAKGDLIVYTADYDEYGTLVYSACGSLVFGNLGLLYADVELEESADGKVHAEGCEIVSVDRF